MAEVPTQRNALSGHASSDLEKAVPRLSLTTDVLSRASVEESPTLCLTPQSSFFVTPGSPSLCPASPKGRSNASTSADASRRNVFAEGPAPRFGHHLYESYASYYARHPKNLTNKNWQKLHSPSTLRPPCQSRLKSIYLTADCLPELHPTSPHLINNYTHRNEVIIGGRYIIVKDTDSQGDQNSNSSRAVSPGGESEGVASSPETFLCSDSKMGDPKLAITRGVLRQILGGATAAELHYDPVVQITSVVPLSSSGGRPPRFKFQLNDMEYFCAAGSAAEEVCNMVFNEEIPSYCLVKMTSFLVTSTKSGASVVNITALQVLPQYGTCGDEMLGTPVAAPGAAGTVKTNGSVAPSPALGGVKKQEDASANSFYGAPANRTVPVSAPTAKHANIYPIEAITPFGQKWTIKVRCTNVSEVKHWQNARGEGKLFSVTFMDGTGEIKATGFNQECDSLRPIFEENQVYYVSSPAKIQFAKRQYSNVNNDYEMTFESGTVVEKAEDPDNVPKVRFNFTTISALQEVEANSTVDLIAVIKEVSDLSEATSKVTSKPYQKRELEIVDDTGFAIRLTVWGQTAQHFSTPPGSVVAFKGLKVSDFAGRSLSLLSSGSMTVNPDIEEAFRLKGWYDAAGQNESFNTHEGLVSGSTGAATSGGANQNFKTLAQVKDEHIGMGEEGEYFNVKATIVFIRQGEFAYPACPNTQQKCQKKVTNVGDGEWRCEKCNMTFPAPLYRYLTSVHVNDSTGQLWFSCFDESGVVIFGMTADELRKIQEEDQKAYEAVMKEASLKTWIWRVRAKQDTYQDQSRVRYQVVSCRPVDWSSEGQRLVDLIKAYSIE